ncbi:MAG: hypothetical protein HYU36_00610 [Planctomycetes bacterium]|nr:hypothetical protein [Planctomycetota bacterium]
MILFWLLFPGALAETPASSPQVFQWAAWEIPAGATDDRGSLAIVEDEAAESRRKVKGQDGQETEKNSALQVRVTRRAIAKGGLALAQTPIIPWKDIRPGVYRISARLKYAGDRNGIGTPVRVSVQAVEADYGGGQDFYSFDLGDEDAYAQVSFLYEVDPTLSKRLPARSARHSWHFANFLAEIYPGYKPPPPPQRPVSPGIQVAVSLPQTKYSPEKGLPPNSLRAVNLDWLRLERIQPSPSLSVRFVRARRRWLRPGESQAFDLAVENFQAEPMTRTLAVSLVHGLADRQEVHRAEISMKPGEARSLQVDWPTTAATHPWGYEVRAEILNGGEVEYATHDVFSVHSGVYPVHLMGSNYRTPDPFRERESLQNLVEVFGATPGDCAQILPSADQWLCGMSDVVQTFPAVRATIEHNRSIGVATHMYLFAGGTSTPIMDLYIRRPEWLASRLVATDEVYRLRRAASEAIRQHDFSTGPFLMPKIPHIEEHFNHWFPELMDQITREAVEFARRTGYEGIRFDVGIFSPKSVSTVFGEPLPFRSEDMMAHAARNFDRFKGALRQVFPNFEFGANMDSWAYLELVGRRNQPAPDPETYPEFIAFARAGGMFMDEGTMDAPGYDHYMNRFEDALWSMCQKRGVARRYGGVYQLFSPHRDGAGYFAHDDIYWTILIIASGSHYVGRFSAAPYSEDSPGEFITRFSEFFRSPGLRPIPEAEDRIRVDSPSLLWFADAASFEDVGDRRRYVVPLINPPVIDRFRRNKSNELPPPIEEPFAIEVQVPEGYRSAKAWMLTWETRVAAVPLDAQVQNGIASVNFPGLQLFRTLVLEFER